MSTKTKDEKKEAEPLWHGNADLWKPKDWQPGAKVRLTTGGSLLNGKVFTIGCNRIAVKAIKRSDGTVTPAAPDVYGRRSAVATAVTVLDRAGFLRLTGKWAHAWGRYDVGEYATKVEVLTDGDPIAEQEMNLYPGAYSCHTKGHSHQWWLSPTGQWSVWEKDRTPFAAPLEPSCEVMFRVHLQRLTLSEAEFYQIMRWDHVSATVPRSAATGHYLYNVRER